MVDGNRQYSKRTVSARDARAQRSGTHAKNKQVRSTVRAKNAQTRKRIAQTKKSEPVFDAARIVKAAGRNDANFGSVLAATGQSIKESKVAIAILLVIALLLFGGIFDAIAHGGKAYGNVKIGDMSVEGMSKEQIVEALRAEYQPSLDSSSVVVYANQETYDAIMNPPEEPENTEEDDEYYYEEEYDVEEEYGESSSWAVNGALVGAYIDYEAYADQALQAGRGAGPFSRVALQFSPVEIPVSVSFDENKLETISKEIDVALGNPREDATVVVNDGVAVPVEGKDGTIVNRAALEESLQNVFLGKQTDGYIIAESQTATSRTTPEQAQEAADAINQAIADGASFVYQGETWFADAAEIGSWLNISVFIGEDDSASIGFSVNSDAATQALMHNVDARVTIEDITVTFEVSGSDVFVHTVGEAEIPDVIAATSQFNDALFGENGKAYSDTISHEPVPIEILNAPAPETMTFTQAKELGIITVIGEYSTDFSNEPGTENRNHNIKLAADLLNNSIVPANGGVWSFHDTAGDTNQDPPFASAGSIVNGEFVDSIGGGICQVATTVFNAVYESGLNVDKRWNHTIYIASYPTGRDAAVSYPDLDLIWSNDLSSDVLLKMSYTDTSITATLYSVATGYHVESELGEWIEGDKYKTEFIHDDELPEGYSYVKTYGSDGSKISVTRYVYDKNGNQVRVNEFASVYPPRNEVYVVGPNTDTKKLERDYEPEPETDSTSEYYDEYSDYGYDESYDYSADGAY